MTRQAKAILLALFTVSVWSTIATASKLSLGYLSVAQLVFYASSTSFSVLFITLLVQGKLPLLKTLQAKDFAVSALYGLLNPFLYYLALFKAYELLAAQQAQIINYSWAITMTLLSIPLLGQKVSRTQWLAILISYLGVVVIATKGEVLALRFEQPAGVFFALISTLIWALYWIYNTKDSRDPVVGLFLNFAFALPVSGLYLLQKEGLQILPWQAYLGAVYIGVFEMGISFVFWLMAMRLTDNTAKIANLIFISPFLSLFFINRFVGEAIHPSTLVGLVLVLAGLLLQALMKTSSNS